ncbi:alpha/beta fold hydrolase [Rufibacter tibetensis]|uniref:Haloalkane dehalogenase n=1 Tax=Rufibacter tibetensis TaxID=512763 RepID=A0A0P0C874_9BACT|nr:alpha/beta hydrolase [Rufibacter tibetensis]ALJ01499.1 haloalkane dehalogenase [Rufibacter tibetensis]
MKQELTVDQVLENHKSNGTFLEVEGVRAFALDQGSGEAVFCVHGVPTSSFLYRKVIAELAHQGFRGICVDLPGLGLSDRPKEFEYSFPNFARFLAKAAEKLGLEKYHLVVHDIGGPIGFALAAQNPDSILSLTILNTWIDVVSFEKPLPMRPFEKPLLGEAQLATVQHTTWYLLFSNLAVSDTEGIPKEEAYAYVDLLKREDNGAAFLKIMRNFDHREEFRQLCLKAVQNVPYPIQAIWGGEDPALTYERYGKEIERLARPSQMHLVKGKHLLQEDQWKEIADKVVQQAELNRNR